MTPGHMDFGLESAESIRTENVASVREALRLLGLVIAQIDRDLRYVWIDNPHPDFDPRTVVGKRDDELTAPHEAAPLMALKKQVIDTGVAQTRVLSFERSDGRHYYNVAAVAIRDAAGNVTAALTAAVHLKADA